MKRLLPSLMVVFLLIFSFAVKASAGVTVANSSEGMKEEMALSSAGEFNTRTRVMPPPCEERDTITETICSFSSYTFYGNTYSLPGTYHDTVVGACDTIHTLILDTTAGTYPTITITPSGSTVCFNDSVVISSSFTFGGTSQTYIWKKNGATFGTNSPTLRVPYDSLSNGDSFQCVLISTDPCTMANPVNSNTVVLNKSSIVKQTMSLTGNTIDVGVVANGYQWYKDNILMTNDTNQTLWVSLYENACYVCEVSDNLGCSVKSWNLCIFPTACLGRDTINETICSFSSYSFGGNSYSLPGTYHDTVLGGPCDSIHTLILDTTAGTDPSMTLSASGNVVCFDDSVVISSTVLFGGPSPTYQWKKNGVAFGDNESSLTVHYDSLNNGDYFHCVLISTDPCTINNPVNSDTVTLTKSGLTKPVMTMSNDTIDVGVVAAGYQWYDDNGLMVNDTNSILVVSLYDTNCFVCEVTDNLGCSVKSWNLCVFPTNCLERDTINETICSFSNYTFYGTTYSLPGTYHDTITGGTCDTIHTLVLDTTSGTDPSMTLSASGNVVCFDDSVVISSTVLFGGPSPTFQWEKNGVAFGGNTPSLTVHYDSLSNGDWFHCVLISTDPCTINNPVNSDTVTLTKSGLTKPVMTMSNDTIDVGVVAAGYQWYDDNGLMVNDTNSILVVSLYDTACYVCEVTDNLGCSVESWNLCVFPTTCVVADTITETICSFSSYTFYGNTYSLPGTYAHVINGTCDTVHRLILDTTAGKNPVMTLTPSGSVVCIGDSVVISSSVTFGGPSPTFQWKKNGAAFGGNTSSLTVHYDSLSNGDSFHCVMISNDPCTISNPVNSNTVVLTKSASCSSVGPCTELFISEYIEGTGNNKVLEVYNPTSDSIDLSNYSIEVFANGATSAATLLPLSGFIQANDVHVIADASALPVFTSNADQLFGGLGFNGNDAIVLFKSTDTVDIIGKIGQDPGASGWGALTTNQSMYRKSAINKGVENNPAVFDPTIEWNIEVIDDSTHLGFHNSTCDSCVTIYHTIFDTICNGDSVLFVGNYYKLTGYYYDTTTAANGCDSITILDLEVTSAMLPTISVAASPSMPVCTGTIISFSTSITNGGSSPIYQWKRNGSNVGTGLSTYSPPAGSNNNGDVITCVLTSSLGCAVPSSVSDSVTLNISNGFTVNIADSICSGDSVLFAGVYRTGAGSFADTVTLGGGCDSITNLTLTIASGFVINISDSICTGDSLLFAGVYRTTAGSFADTVTLGSGCDSITNLTLTYKVNCGSCTNVTTSLVDSICSGDSVLFAGAYYNSPGVYHDTTVIAGGCDSIVTLTLSSATFVTPSITISANATTICPNQSVSFTSSITNGGTVPSYNWLINGGAVATGASFTSSGGQLGNGDVVSCYLISSASCANPDTVYSNTIAITVGGSTTTTLADTICQDEFYSFGGNNLNTSGVYYDTISNTGGCDSIVQLNLQVYPSPIVLANSDVDTISVGGTVNFYPNGSNASNYLWDFGDANSSTLNTVSHTYNTVGTFTVILKGELLFGCTTYDTLTITVLNNAGIDENDIFGSLIKVYPNPVKDNYSIEFSLSERAEIQIQLYNTNGELLQERLMNVSSETISFNDVNYERGVYFLHIKSDKYNTIKRIVVID